MRFFASILAVYFLGIQGAFAEVPDFQFGVLADVQYSNAPDNGSLRYQASPKKLDEAVQAFNSADLAFVIHLGDFIDDDFSSFETLLPIWRKLKHPSYHVLGNHDFSVDAHKKSQVPEVMGLSSRYYDFQVQQWRMIVLDGNDISFHANLPDSPKHEEAKAYYETLREAKQINALPTNGAMGSEQLVWLRETLSDSCKRGQTALVFSHFPVYPDHQTNLWNQEALREVLESFSCVFAYMNGHNHLGGYGVKAGIHYVTLQGVVETQDTSAFARVSLYPDRIEIDGHGREKDRTLRRGAEDYYEEPAERAEVKLSKARAREQSQRETGFQMTPIQESRAYQQYLLRTPSELSKLVFLMDRFRDLDVIVIYDGQEYDTAFALKVARRYLAKNYRKENAIEWIRLHVYRSQHAGQVIKMRYPDGKQVQVRDTFIEELQALDSLAKG